MNQFRTIAAAFALTAGLAGQASAEMVEPAVSQVIDLGTVSGDFYYTARPDGLHVVATFAEPGQGGKPVRFETVLAPGQSVTVSTPRDVDMPSEAVRIVRQADRVDVRRAPPID